MKALFVINGNPLSGKDKFIELVSKFLKVKNISSVDKVKESAKLLGWNGDKDDNSRRFLSDIKLLSVEYSNHPFEYVKSEIEEFYKDDNDIMFMHIREPDEIKKIVKEFRACTILVTRKEAEVNMSNISDAFVGKYSDYDITIDNNGNEDELKKIASDFADYLKEMYK